MLWIINKEFFGNIKFHGAQISIIWNINKLNTHPSMKWSQTFGSNNYVVMETL